jgi:polyketide biosynthesis acyl carrier protein
MRMSKEVVFSALKKVVSEIMPDIEPERITPEESLRDLGANSVDRMDIVIGVMEELKLKIPLVEFGKVHNIQGLVDLLYSHAISA